MHRRGKRNQISQSIAALNKYNKNGGEEKKKSDPSTPKVSFKILATSFSSRESSSCIAATKGVLINKQWKKMSEFDTSNDNKSIEHQDKEQIYTTVESFVQLKEILVHTRFVTYCKIKGIDNLEETGPKTSDSSEILRITLRTMSPRYIPDIIFSKPCKTLQQKTVRRSL